MSFDTSVVINTIARVTGDVLSFGIVVATLAKALPPLAALISIIWIGFQFYHSEPMVARRLKRKERNGTD